MKFSAKLLVPFVAIAGALSLATAGWAYWTTSGSGSASTSVGTLAPPTAVTVPLTSTSPVAVSWTASSTASPNATPTGYYVERSSDSTTWSFACGSSLTTFKTSPCNDTVGNGTYTYKVTAVFRSWTASAVSSGSVSVSTTGPAAKLVFTQQPSGSTGGVAFGTQPKVTVQDSGGNTVTTDTGSVTLAITTPAGATLTCTTNPIVNATAGVASFAGCAIDKSGSYTLTASRVGLTPNGVSSSLTISVGSATKLGFTQQPGNSTGGIAFAPQPNVAVQDAGGNTVTTDAGSVTLAITTPAGATLTCTTNPIVNAAAGVASFAGCTIDKSGSYTLTASRVGLTPNGVSNSFTITVGTVAKFGLGAPTSTPAGTPFTVTLAAQDAGGNTVSSYANGNHTITWSGAPTGPNGNAPSYPLATVSFTNGVSTTALSATLYSAGATTLTAAATSPTLTGSATITVTALTATHLAWTSTSGLGLSSPCSFSCSSSTNNVNFKAKVSLTDNYGNPVNAASAITVTVTKSGGTFTPNNPTTTVTIAAGTSESSIGGNASPGVGQITFTDTGHYTDTVTAADGGTHTAATGTFTN